jgi:hypothetical protein
MIYCEFFSMPELMCSTEIEMSPEPSLNDSPVISEKMEDR